MPFAEALQSVVASRDHVSGMELVLECVERAGDPEVVAGVREALGRAFSSADEATGLFLVQAVLEHLLEDERYREAFVPWSQDPVLGSHFREAVELADWGAKLRRAATRVAERAAGLWKQGRMGRVRVMASHIGTGSCELELRPEGTDEVVSLFVSVGESLAEALTGDRVEPELVDRAARAAIDRGRWKAVEGIDGLFETEVGGL